MYWESAIEEVDDTLYTGEAIVVVNTGGLVQHDWFKHYACGVEFYTDSLGLNNAVPEFGLVSLHVTTPLLPNTWQILSPGEFSVDCSQQVDWASFTNKVRVSLRKMTLDAPYFRLRVVGMAA
jgi:hypothetical protein